MPKSISPYGELFEFEIKPDIEKINNFKNSNLDKTIVVIQGLGFVGTAMALVVANSMDGDRPKYAVIVVDLPEESSYWKIAMINNGSLPIRSDDPKMDRYFENVMRFGNLIATHDAYAYSVADIIVVDVQLDVIKQRLANSDESICVNIDSFKAAIATIGNHMKPGSLVIIETTVPPGTCEYIVRPILEKSFQSRKLLLSDLMIAHSYERVMPGRNYIDSIKNYFRVLSGINKKSVEAAKSFLKSVINTMEYPLTVLDNTNASEIAKLLENTFRAANIALVQEWTILAEKSGVNLFKVVNAIRKRDTHRNLMLPGFGVGGYCLPKDPLFAEWATKEIFKIDHSMEMSLQAVTINDLMPLHTLNHIKDYHNDLQSKVVAIFGVSYREDISDLRNTPVGIFYDYLCKENAKIFLHDPFIQIWSEKNLSISSNLEEVVENDLDVLVFTVRHLEYLTMDINKLLQKLEGRKCLIVDSNDIFNDSKINLILDSGHDYIGIGKGHIGYLFSKHREIK